MTRAMGSEKLGGRLNIVANNTRSATTTNTPKQAAESVSIGRAANFWTSVIDEGYGCVPMSAMGRKPTYAIVCCGWEADLQ